MSNYYGNARTNYFRVKDEEAFLTWVADMGLTLWRGRDENLGAFALGPGEFSDNGTLDLPWNEETDEPYDIVEELSQHLADGSVCVVMESGAEKLRYITGNAVAFDNTGEFVQVNLNDIYQLAKEKFGVEPTACQY